MKRAALTVLVFAFCVGPGCRRGGGDADASSQTGGSGDSPAVAYARRIPVMDRTLTQNDLRSLGMFLQTYKSAQNKWPTKLEELTEMKIESPKIYNAVADGQYVVVWGAPADATVIAYEAATVKGSGSVLTGGGEIRLMTAEELRQALPRR